MDYVKNITKQTFAFLLIGFACMLVANEAMYKHTHQINGRLITHSHPYKTPADSSSSPEHQHNKAQFVFWENLQVLFPFIALSFFILNCSQPVFREIQSILFVYTAPQVHYPGRAPPAS
ncbi:MAG: hypothetical protein KGY60_01535 [Bacteroidales bacterium]|nr:hypothetical protein [Bacteroidales bacterium]